MRCKNAGRGAATQGPGEGWTVAACGSGHWRLSHPDASRAVIIPATPSCSRWHLNALAEMRRVLPPVVRSQSGQSGGSRGDRRRDQSRDRCRCAGDRGRGAATLAATTPRGRPGWLSQHLVHVVVIAVWSSREVDHVRLPLALPPLPPRGGQDATEAAEAAIPLEVSAPVLEPVAAPQAAIRACPTCGDLSPRSTVVGFTARPHVGRSATGRFGHQAGCIARQDYGADALALPPMPWEH